MERNARQFRQKYKAETNITIEEFIKREAIKIRTSKELNDKQKKERLEALDNLLNEINSPQGVIDRRNEDRWEK